MAESRNELLAEIVRLSGISREELTMEEGHYFVGSSTRAGVAVGTSYFTLVQAGAKALTVEDIIVTLDFSSVASGQFNYTMQAFVDISNGNEWTATGGTTSPVGRPINALRVNDLPLSTVRFGVTSSPTGAPDYPIYFADYYLDTQGNRSVLSVARNSFFEAGRKIIIPPGGQVLIQSLTTGNATGTAEVKTQFFTSEA